MSRTNLYPLLLDNVNVLEFFEVDGRLVAYPQRWWRANWTFSEEPREPSNWAYLTHPISEPIFRRGRISHCFFQSGNQQITCSIAVHDCYRNRDGTFFVTGILIETPETT